MKAIWKKVLAHLGAEIGKEYFIHYTEKGKIISCSSKIDTEDVVRTVKFSNVRGDVGIDLQLKDGFGMIHLHTMLNGHVELREIPF